MFRLQLIEHPQPTRSNDTPVIVLKEYHAVHLSVAPSFIRPVIATLLC